MYDDTNYNDLSYNAPYDRIIDMWFDSDVWKNIVAFADDGDEDSLELMERCNEQLSSLMFHINNNSGKTRIDYEVSYFKKLCLDFDVA